VLLVQAVLRIAADEEEVIRGWLKPRWAGSDFRWIDLPFRD